MRVGTACDQEGEHTAEKFPNPLFDLVGLEFRVFDLLQLVTVTSFEPLLIIPLFVRCYTLPLISGDSQTVDLAAPFFQAPRLLV